MSDVFEKELDKKIEEIHLCQSNNNVDSCLKCPKMLGCEVRNSYVDSVYSSMNEGKGGFFSFETE